MRGSIAVNYFDAAHFILLDTRTPRWMRTMKKQITYRRITLVIAVRGVQYIDNPPPVREPEGKHG
jgi:hypothetical protein